MSEDIEYFPEVVYLVMNCLRCLVILGMGIEPHDIKSGTFGTEDVCLEIVANHKGGFGFGTSHAEGVIEIEWRGFVGTGIFRQHYRVEIVLHSAGLQLAVLHLVETVAAHVQAIATGLEIVHHLVRSVYNTGLHGTEFQKTVAYLQAILHTDVLQSMPPAQRTAETLHDKDIAGNLSGGILLP